MVFILLLNKKGFMEIACNKKSNSIKVGFSPTKLVANVVHLADEPYEIITPVWIVECDNIEHYNIEETKCGKELLISTDDAHTGAIMKVTLIDKEKKYVGASIQLEVVSFY